MIATKVHEVMREEPNGRGLSRKAIRSSSIKVSAGWARTMSISTRFIVGITTRRLRRRLKRCMTW